VLESKRKRLIGLKWLTRDNVFGKETFMAMTSFIKDGLRSFHKFSPFGLHSYIP